MKHEMMQIFKNVDQGFGEMHQWLQACTDFVGDLCIVPAPMSGSLRTACNSSSRGFEPSPGLFEHLHSHVHKTTHAHTHIHIILKLIINLKERRSMTDAKLKLITMGSK